jgi:hypothetical protein
MPGAQCLGATRRQVERQLEPVVLGVAADAVLQTVGDGPRVQERHRAQADLSAAGG